ncbi:MAG: cytochrome c3 family protein [Chloroflexi bacterium]|nr:cytochrome c3 family protein [Chloroflexota bacterium]
MKSANLWIIIGGIAVAAAVAWFSAAQAAPGAPQVPHGVAGQEKCLTCHGSQGVRPVPSGHAAFDEKSCLGCHSPSAAAPPAASPQQDCLGCHVQPSLSMTLASGETLPLVVNRKAFATSIHGDKLSCTGCHSSISAYPHPESEIPSRRDYRVAQYELCQNCHFDNYTRMLDSAHYQLLAGGDARAPVCADCHGAHYVTPPSQPRTEVSRTCSACHQDVYSEYAASVHGRAISGENGGDVPVCTDCHTAHSIESPLTAAFRLQSVKLCSDCHGDKELMQKYGLSTNVVKSYLEDFHGKSVALVGKQSKEIWAEAAVCTDCHGVHDIQAVDDPDSPVLKANLASTCSKCHPGATANFPGAWLSHYEPGMDKATLVFLVRWFYRVLIPFILAGLLVHIGLGLWRALKHD